AGEVAAERADQQGAAEQGQQRQDRPAPAAGDEPHAGHRGPVDDEGPDVHGGGRAAEQPVGPGEDVEQRRTGVVPAVPGERPQLEPPAADGAGGQRGGGRGRTRGRRATPASGARAGATASRSTQGPNGAGSSTAASPPPSAAVSPT